MKTRLEFAIGPVQGFVAQSRRTRDLWGSSYLLSFLSAHAILGASRVDGARIVHPLVENDPMFRWVRGEGGDGGPPTVGSIPNQFAAEVDGDPVEAARAAGKAFRAAWDRICDVVWERFVAHAEHLGQGTRAIWDRQVQSFWELSWVAGEAGEQGLLARRKMWRSHVHPDEPGDKCTVMPRYQELSGFVRARGEQDREPQDAFWEKMRQRTGPLDLREDEQLSAIALVKRLYPKVSREALGWKVDRSRWPSVAYLAAIPWIREVLASIPGEAEEYAGALQDSVAALHAERIEPFHGMDSRSAGGFAALDASCFFQGFLRDERICPLEPGASRDDLVTMLGKLYGSSGSAGERIGPPSPFYALLLADGDQLGRLVNRLGSERVGRALAEFTSRVERTVRSHDGVTVYAGGDDVLAILPVKTALECARGLRKAYSAAFGALEEGMEPPTLSAAVVFAHMRLGLMAVIGEAHRLLDDVAKDGNGRNSLAVGLLKRGGLNAQWVSAWSRPTGDGAAIDAVDAVTAVTGSLGKVEGDPGLSSSLLYRLRESLGLLCGWPQWETGEWGKVPKDVDLSAYIRAEILHSLDVSGAGADPDMVDRLSSEVLELLRWAPAGGGQKDSNPRIGFDGLLIARFLAGGGREEE